MRTEPFVSREVQATFDAADPRALSTFWAEVLGYVHPASPGVDRPDGRLVERAPPAARGPALPTAPASAVNALGVQRVVDRFCGTSSEPWAGAGRNLNDQIRAAVDWAAGDW